MSDARPESGEVYLRLFHRLWDPEGIKISHRAGNFLRVRLLMHGAVLFMNRDQTRFLLSQWHELTKQTGLASGWTIQRSYFSEHEECF
jgi:hypothetical protein